MSVLALHHVAMAVEDLDEAVDVYSRLFGAEIERRRVLEAQGVEAVYLRLGEGRIELVAPLGADTPVGRFLAKRGPGMHHVAFEVDDLSGAVATLRGQGAEIIESEPSPGLGGGDVAFIHPDTMNGVLVEVVASDA